MSFCSEKQEIRKSGTDTPGSGSSCLFFSILTILIHCLNRRFTQISQMTQMEGGYLVPLHLNDHL